jgi:hypothetical protein
MTRPESNDDQGTLISRHLSVHSVTLWDAYSDMLIGNKSIVKNIHSW